MLKPSRDANKMHSVNRQPIMPEAQDRIEIANLFYRKTRVQTSQATVKSLGNVLAKE